MRSLVSIVGDFDPRNGTHIATNNALDAVGLRFQWIPTPDLDPDAERRLADSAGVWIAPASPYQSMAGALRAIRYARERGVPLVGT